MNVLLVSPEYPDTFWGFRHVLKYISKSAGMPPLGLLTVATMLPREWNKKLVDMNVASLCEKDIEWADYVFISAMIAQKKSVNDVVKLCKALNTKIVAGGPLFTTGYDEYDEIDHLVLNEAEVTLSHFLEDLKNGCAKHLYSSHEFPDISVTPIPAWELVDLKKYNSMALQYSRGCPFDCEFCDIMVLNGRMPRTKTREQVIRELDAIYDIGWRRDVFIVDDNFIGNKKKLKIEILPAIIDWLRKKKNPFSFFTEVSLNIADDDELIDLMVEADFKTLFVGIESPNDQSLAECGKKQNRNRDMIASVKKLQKRGFQVHAGFIIGFDNDTPEIFDKQIDFIQESGIVTAMVGLLNAPAGTRLYKRLESENRIAGKVSGDNMDCSLNFIPKMDYPSLIEGYKRVIQTIYSHKYFYRRITTFLKEYRLRENKVRSRKYEYVRAFFRSVWHIGFIGKGRIHYWKLLVCTFLRYPAKLPMAISLAIYGYHFRKIAENYLKVW